MDFSEFAFMSWTRLGHVSGMCWICVGNMLDTFPGMRWQYVGNDAGRFWAYCADMLGMFLQCFGHVSDKCPA